MKHEPGRVSVALGCVQVTISGRTKHSDHWGQWRQHSEQAPVLL